MFRYRSTKKRYANQSKGQGCPFCKLGEARVIHQTTHAAVIKNIFPYDLWEHSNVTDHLMIVPRRHVSSLSQLSPAERADIMEFISQYEAKNYNVYSRSHKSVQKSVPEHQHTHLIATDAKQARFVIFSKKPYWLFRK